MQDQDIDEIVDEVEQWLGKDDEVPDACDRLKDGLPERGREQNTAPSSTCTANTDDLDALLDDLEMPVKQPFRDVVSLPGIREKNKSTRKCWPPYLTGTTTQPSFTACSHLRCLKCDCKVVSFDGWLWHDEVSYLFLRTNYPVIEKLRARLEPQRTGRAYACQCRKIGVVEPLNLNDVDDKAWVCSAK